jgi:predicted metal-dependent hydrolase
MIDYILKRSKRKTAAIYIRDGSVEVRAPLRISKRDIDKFIESKEKWITDRLAKSNKQTSRREHFILDYGSLVTYRGNQYPIQAKEISRAGFDGECFYMPPDLAAEQIKDVCVQIYRRLAKQYLTERTLVFAEQMNVVPASIKINGARTRWGSCSAKKNINYSWRLVMADDDVIDYVVIHETAHLVEMNHSKKFWSAVEYILPDYRDRRAGLKALQHRLDGENWEY